MPTNPQQRWRGGPLLFEVMSGEDVLLSFEAKPDPARPILVRGKFDFSGATEFRVTVPQEDGDTNGTEDSSSDT